MKEVREALEVVASDEYYNKAHVENIFEQLELYAIYDVATWHIDEIQKIEKSLSILAEKSFAANVCQDITKANVEDAGEALKFVKLLFEGAFYKDRSRFLSDVRALVSRYPENQAYTYLLINMVYKNGEYELDLLLEAQKEACSLVMKCTNSSSQHTYVVIGINLSVRLFYKYLALHEFTKAKEVIDQLDNVKPFAEDSLINNVLAGLPFALEQNKSLYELNKISLTEMENKVNKLGQDNNKKSFEILIVFTAVITFLVTAAGATTSEHTSIAGLASLGLTLLTFIVASLMCLERPKNLFSDPRLIVLVLALLSTIAMALVDKYDKFELWAENSVYIEFPTQNSEEFSTVNVPFRLE